MGSVWLSWGGGSGVSPRHKFFKESIGILTAQGAKEHRQIFAGSLASLLIREARAASAVSDKVKNYREARDLLEDALGFSDAMLLNSARNAKEREKAIELVEGLHASLSLCCYRLGDLNAAFDAAERGRLRLAYEMQASLRPPRSNIGDADARRKFNATVVERQSFRWQLGYRSGPTLEIFPRMVATEERRRVEERYIAATEALFFLLRQHGIFSLPEPITGDDANAVMRDCDGLVLIVVQECETFCFVLTADKMQIREIRGMDGAPTLSEEILRARLFDQETGWKSTYKAAFREVMPDVHEDRSARDKNSQTKWRAEVQDILLWLWQAIAGQLDLILEETLDRAGPEDDGAPSKHPWIVISSPGLLAGLPIGGARSADCADPFGEKWSLSFAPSLTSFIEFHGRAVKARSLPPQFLGVFDPASSHHDTKKLNGARLEGEWLKRKFSAAKPQILFGEAAGRDRVLGLLPGRTHLHFSTHATHDPDNPGESCIILAGPDKLKLCEMPSAKFEGVRMTYLSACETGLAGISKLADEFHGLANGFLQQGAAAVVASLWPVFDDAAYLLTTRFYDEWLDSELNEQITPAEALRRAQVWLRKLTYGELRTEFSVTDKEGVSYLLIGKRRKSGTSATVARVDPNSRAEPGIVKRGLQIIRVAAAGFASTRTKVDKVASNEGVPVIEIPLGPDSARPYETPDKWCAFALSGA